MKRACRLRLQNSRSTFRQRDEAPEHIARVSLAGFEASPVGILPLPYLPYLNCNHRASIEASRRLEFAPRGRHTFFFQSNLGLSMISKCIALLVAVTSLAGCCLSGNGCSPPAPTASLTWDGLGQGPSDDGRDNDKPARTAPRKREMVTGQQSEKAAPSDKTPQGRWEQQKAADKEADAQLSAQLKICRGC